MSDEMKYRQEPTAAAEGGIHDEHHVELGNHGAASQMVAHAGTNKTKRATATRRQIAANRANAARSTGPRTVEGKEVVARNAIKHGLTSRSVLLPGDDEKAYKIFVAGMTIFFAPQGTLEEELLQQIVNAMWVRRRIQQIESGALRYLVSDDIDPAVFADLWIRLPDSLSRYAAAKDRVIFRAMQELGRLQEQRKEKLSDAPVQRQKFHAAYDELHTVQKLIETRIKELERKPEAKPNTNAEPEMSPASPRTLDAVLPLKPSKAP
jgi:hypothetical protein